MVNKKSTKTTTSTTTSAKRHNPLRTKLVEKKKVNYNIHHLATVAFNPKPVVEKKKVVPKKKTATVKKTKGAKGGATYLDTVKRILKAADKGMSLPAILKQAEKQYPERAVRRYLRLALARGVLNKSLVQTRQTFRLSAKELKRIAKKKSATKKTTAKKTSGTKRKATDKKTTTKKPKKSTTTKKTATKKTATKKAAAPKKPAAKKAKTTPKESTSTVAEIRGVLQEGVGNAVWQYYDNGWHDYYPEASNIVEGVYQEYKANPIVGIDIRAVKSGHFSYMVDFANLTQTNTQTQTVRNIQRRLE